MMTHKTTPRPTDAHPDDRPTVMVVDDDIAIREALSDLVESAGYAVVAFGSTQDVLSSETLDMPGCLVLDVRMPGASGLELHRQLQRSGNTKPVIFLTGFGDIPMSVDAMRGGAIDFLTKPVRDQTLLDAIAVALAKDAKQRAAAAKRKVTLDLLDTLTPRELEVLKQVARGRLNKQIAFELTISEVTVKLHRSNAMRKMGLRSVSDLIHAWQSLPENFH
ncbi:MAG: response regulator transcription factor [Sphingomonadales bacterium]|nr:MAG: response regulator transcription factor [Sphingomonadales bacterium]